mmetsp:Transcript_14465/g.22607  ORF Transcript_14465/g.22607 Transcript_14465/m.22607 type:complete len:410 (-) Transcript_14465:67-1296(-)|eukprot:CAMPEP_0195299526 /NCGR_PEP_ID=MMETSP0707-20130614/25709_1 /TAXON_ID=33640 /ORGANISM="Asterionellopsis glacialis, Strain CCMP134" /LENGTH=409 /DNA_ID=CAMNT_0040361957 /DNA_START=110 /DNA_END=1339 /DNA_ORIENTATION=+
MPRNKNDSNDQCSSASSKRRVSSRSSVTRSERRRKKEGGNTTEKKAETLSRRMSFRQPNGLNGKSEFHTWGGTNIALFLFSVTGCVLLSSWSSRGTTNNLRKFHLKRRNHGTHLLNNSKHIDVMPDSKPDRTNKFSTQLPTALRGSEKVMTIINSETTPTEENHESSVTDNKIIKVAEPRPSRNEKENLSAIQSTNQILKHNLGEEVWNSEDAQYLAARVEKVSHPQTPQMKVTDGGDPRFTSKARENHGATENTGKITWPSDNMQQQYEDWKKVMETSARNGKATTKIVQIKQKSSVTSRQNMDQESIERKTSTVTDKTTNSIPPNTSQISPTEQYSKTRPTKASLEKDFSTKDTNSLQGMAGTNDENTVQSIRSLSVATPFVLAPFVVLGIFGFTLRKKSLEEALAN